MKCLFKGGRLFASWCILAVLHVGFVLGGTVNVTQHHNHATRDGLYIDPAFTQTRAANLKRDTNFSGVIKGNVYAQPLYIEGRPDGRAMIIAVTESNNRSEERRVGKECRSR